MARSMNDSVAGAFRTEVEAMTWRRRVWLAVVFLVSMLVELGLGPGLLGAWDRRPVSWWDTGHIRLGT